MKKAYKQYTSKDFIIFGSHLEFEDSAWDKIDKRMRTAVRKAKTYNPIIKKVKGTKEDIEKFYPFTPNREDLPEQLNEKQHMYFAYLDGELAGGIIVSEIDDYLYLHFHASTEKGKKHQIPSLLLWNIAEEFKDTKFKYLDVGASYRPSLQKYFSGWATKKYPIIMHPPKLKPQIMITPFDNQEVFNFDNKIDFNKAKEALDKVFGGKEYTFFPRGMYAIYSLLKWLQLEESIGKGQEVCIKTTTESPYISNCVTSAIEEVCGWGREISEETKVLFVIHEFGFPHPKIKEFRKLADEKDLILVEDCAYAWGSGDAGKYGDYIIYSATKIFPAQFGGFLVGKKFELDYMWNNLKCADLGKEELITKSIYPHLKQFNEIAKKRRDNYRYYESIFGKENSFFQLKDEIIPGAYLLRMKNYEEMTRTSEFVRAFGIECGNYWQKNAIFLPVHQKLNKPQLDYIAGAVFGSNGYEEIIKKINL